jgi:hypothetical protein
MNTYFVLAHPYPRGDFLLFLLHSFLHIFLIFEVVRKLINLDLIVALGCIALRRLRGKAAALPRRARGRRHDHIKCGVAGSGDRSALLRSGLALVVFNQNSVLVLSCSRSGALGAATC